MLPEKLLPATISTVDLARNAGKANVALRYMTRSSGSHELDLKLWEKTLLEVDRGWLVGPLDWETLGDDCTLSRRFPLDQSGKVRPIDDLSQSQINATVTCFEQATVDGPDVICAFAVYMMRCLATASRCTELLEVVGLGFSLQATGYQPGFTEAFILVCVLAHQQACGALQADWPPLWIKDGGQRVHQVRSVLAVGGG